MHSEQQDIPMGRSCAQRRGDNAPGFEAEAALAFDRVIVPSDLDRAVIAPRADGPRGAVTLEPVGG